MIFDLYHNRWPSCPPVSLMIQCISLSIRIDHNDNFHFFKNAGNVLINISFKYIFIKWCWVRKYKLWKEGKKNRDKVSGSLVSTTAQIFQLVWESIAWKIHFSNPRERNQTADAKPLDLLSQQFCSRLGLEPFSEAVWLDSEFQFDQNCRFVGLVGWFISFPGICTFAHLPQIETFNLKVHILMLVDALYIRREAWLPSIRSIPLETPIPLYHWCKYFVLLLISWRLDLLLCHKHCYSHCLQVPEHFHCHKKREINCQKAKTQFQILL